MVSRCANPDCGAPFLYLRPGKLFVMPRSGFSTRRSRVEYFWLCGNCAGKMTIGGDCIGNRPVRQCDAAHSKWLLEDSHL
jgi:hypothetical protein